MALRNRLRWATIITLAVAGGPARADPLPTQVGECSSTLVKNVETRLEDGKTGQPIPGSGSAVNFDNGGYQVSYDTEPAIEQSRPGDPVRMCLVLIPQDCPRGDNRGYTYQTTNLRTRQSWTLPNSEHGCGGA
jgi:hypothetical protein